MLVRHAEAALGELASHAPVYAGARRDFARLSERGRAQADRLGDALARRGVRYRCVVSSPYTRALETATRLARPLGVETLVDLRLHDWLPVVDGTGRITAEAVARSTEEFVAQGGAPDAAGGGAGSDAPVWETNAAMRARASAAIDDHLGAGGEPIVVVTHEAVVRALVGPRRVEPASAHPIAWRLGVPTG